MKRIPVLLVLVVVFLASCDEKEIRTLNGKWKLVHHYNVETGSVEWVPVTEKSFVFTFSDDGKLGTISGDSLSNDIIGMYELGPHHKISVTPLTVGKAAPRGDTVIDRITSAHYVKVSPNTLNISCNQGRDVLLFVREN